MSRGSWRVDAWCRWRCERLTEMVEPRSAVVEDGELEMYSWDR